MRSGGAACPPHLVCQQEGKAIGESCLRPAAGRRPVGVHRPPVRVALCWARCAAGLARVPRQAAGQAEVAAEPSGCLVALIWGSGAWGDGGMSRRGAAAGMAKHRAAVHTRCSLPRRARAVPALPTCRHAGPLPHRDLDLRLARGGWRQRHLQARGWEPAQQTSGHAEPPWRVSWPTATWGMQPAGSHPLPPGSHSP